MTTLTPMGIRARIGLAAALLCACATFATAAPLPQALELHPPKNAPVAVQCAVAPLAQRDSPRTILQTIAILVAVAVFLTREGLEAKRRQESRQRKVAAIKAILARACELNNWTIKTLTRVFASLPAVDEPDYEGVPVSEFSVSFRRNGQAVLVERQDGKLGSSGPLPEPKLEDLKAALIDVAEVDPDLLSVLDEAITGLEQVSHVRSSLISHILKEDEFDAEFDGFFPGFVDYGREEIADAFKSLDALYRVCTGKSLTEHRVR